MYLYTIITIDKEEKKKHSRKMSIKASNDILRRKKVFLISLVRSRVSNVIGSYGEWRELQITHIHTGIHRINNTA